MYQSHILAHDQLVPLARGPVGMALSVLAGLGATTLRGREHFQLLLCEVVEVAQVLVDLERLLNLLLLGLLFLLFQLLHVVVELVVDRIVPVHVVEAGHIRRVNKIKMHRGEAVKHDTGHETKEILHCNIKWEVNSIFAAVEKNIKHLSKGFSSWESSRTLLTPGYVSSSFLSMCEELIGSTSSFACKKVPR